MPVTPVEDRLDSVIRDLYPQTSLAVLVYEATERIRELKREIERRRQVNAVLVEALEAVQESRCEHDWSERGYWDADNRLDKQIDAAIALAKRP